MASSIIRWLLLCLTLLPGTFAQAGSCPSHEAMRPLLNSERIWACFGSYGVEVLCQKGGVRVSSLYSEEEAGKRLTRTLAVTRFRDEVPAELSDALGEIRKGASIGATLEADGWTVTKGSRYIGEIPMPADFGRMMGLEADGETADSTAAVFVYDLSAHTDGVNAEIATIAEMYDPRYLTLSDLEAIYGVKASQPDAVSRGLIERLDDPIADCRK